MSDSVLTAEQSAFKDAFQSDYTKEVDNLKQSQDTLAIGDYQVIAKTFERGANSCSTRESVFAVLTAHVSNTRSMSKTIGGQMASYSSTEDQNNQSAGNSVVNLDAVENKGENFFTKVGNNFVPGGDDIGGAFNSECIPCILRINFKKELDFKIHNGKYNDVGEQMLATMKAWLDRALSQIKRIIAMFKDFDKYGDLCQLMKFLNDFICIPDLAKILAMLMSLLSDLAFDMNGMIDGIISIIMPFFAPFFTMLIDTLQKFLMLIVKPIECIIDSIQAMLSKLDYNVLFQNLEKTEISIGPKVNGKVKIPILGSLAPDTSPTSKQPAIGEGNRRAVQFSLTPAQKAWQAKQQAAVDRAAKEMDQLRKAASSVDASDPAAYGNYKKQEQAAIKKYRDAKKERDMSEIGEMNQNIEEIQQGLKSSFLQMILFLREAAQKIDAFIRSLFDEFRKLMKQYVGGSGQFIDFASKKLAILQIVAMVKSLIALMKRGKINCDKEDKQVEVFAAALAKDQDFSIYTDANGTIHIEEKAADLTKAIQRLGPLIESTGDPVIDNDVIQAIDDLKRGSSAVFRCQAQTDKVAAEQVNQWIQELNNG